MSSLICFAGFLGRLADHSVQALRNAFELHHAGTQQIALQLRAWRPWAIRSSSAPSMARCKLRCTVATSFTDSAIMRVNLARA